MTSDTPKQDQENEDIDRQEHEANAGLLREYTITASDDPVTITLPDAGSFSTGDLRDQFAMAALPAIQAREYAKDLKKRMPLVEITEEAYRVAVCMMDERRLR